MNLQRIAVIGATGMLGRPVTHALLAAGYTVTVVARQPEQARPLFPGARIVPGDVLAPGTLPQALAGQEAVYLNLSVRPTEKPGDPHTETDGLRNVIAAAREAGLQRLAFLSSLVQRYQGRDGFHWWVFDVKQQALRLVREAGLPYTIFYPSTFMETVLHDYKQGRRLLLFGTSRQPQYFIAGPDYGRQVARSFAVLGEENREYAVQGPEAYTDDEAAAVFARHYTAEPLKITKVPLGVLKVGALVSAQARYGAKIVEALNNYPERFEAQPTWDELGTPTTTLAEYAHQASQQAT